MKPTKKTKRLPRISAARSKETHQRLALYDQEAKADRALHDAMAVADATHKFWERSQKAFIGAAGVSERAQAKAVLIAARKFWEQSTNAVSDAQVALDGARDELIDYNDRRAQRDEAQRQEDLAFLNRWAEAHNAKAKKK